MALSKQAVPMPAPGFTRKEAADSRGVRHAAGRAPAAAATHTGFPGRVNDVAGSRSESTEDESGP